VPRGVPEVTVSCVCSCVWRLDVPRGAPAVYGLGRLDVPRGVPTVTVSCVRAWVWRLDVPRGAPAVTVSGDSTCLGESRRLRSRERVRDCTLSAPRGSPRRFWEEGRSLVCTLARSHAGLVYSHRAPGRPGGCGGRRAGRSFFALARTLARLLAQERARYGIGEGLKGEAHAREVHGRFAGLKGQRTAHVGFSQGFSSFRFY
jgi:hypothetical protein